MPDPPRMSLMPARRSRGHGSPLWLLREPGRRGLGFGRRPHPHRLSHPLVLPIALRLIRQPTRGARKDPVVPMAGHRPDMCRLLLILHLVEKRRGFSWLGLRPTPRDLLMAVSLSFPSSRVCAHAIASVGDFFPHDSAMLPIRFSRSFPSSSSIAIFDARCGSSARGCQAPRCRRLPASPRVGSSPRPAPHQDLVSPTPSSPSSP